jgi:WLM domain
MDSLTPSIPVQLSCQGQSLLIDMAPTVTADDAIAMAHRTLRPLLEKKYPDGAVSLKLLHKGKQIKAGSTNPIFSSGSAMSRTATAPPKILVLVTESAQVEELQSRRSDPTIRGFDQEKLSTNQGSISGVWGAGTGQDKNFKFCRFQPCTWQSFGHRATDKVPHDFEARRLLEKLATDPGVVAVMKERQLVVGTLGEMDPIDDRIMQQKQKDGMCLLGYNTNGGTRIDIKLRSDDLVSNGGFRPYQQLVCTLLHELSHNWWGDHNLLFWTNYAEMRLEYVYAHLLQSHVLIQGKTSAQVAGLPSVVSAAQLRTETEVMQFIMGDLVAEMSQYGLHPRMIQAAIQLRINQLQERRQTPNNHVVAGEIKTDAGSIEVSSSLPSHGSTDHATSSNPREMALLAAERRRREQEEQHRDDGKPKTND